ncbi:MAG: Ig-like domain-containing protein [Lachnospiraceae bacterium]|jgi:hypothetical protein|nr:Ig-like domain-containing protein [Lachnospiraceae bacterium]
MKKMKKIVGVLLTLALVVGVAGFNAQAAKAPKLSKTKLTIQKDATAKLKVSNFKKTVKWSSSNKNVADVYADGTVEGVGEGKCTITAKCGKKKLTCKVTVKYSEKKKATDVWFYASSLCDRIEALATYQEKGRSCEVKAVNEKARLDELMKEVDAYDSICKSLKSEKFESFKVSWETLIKEVKSQYETINTMDWTGEVAKTPQITYLSLMGYLLDMGMVIK